MGCVHPESALPTLDHNLGAQELKFLSKNPKPALRVSKLCKPP